MFYRNDSISLKEIHLFKGTYLLVTINKHIIVVRQTMKQGYHRSTFPAYGKFYSFLMKILLNETSHVLIS